MLPRCKYSFTNDVSRSKTDRNRNSTFERPWSPHACDKSGIKKGNPQRATLLTFQKSFASKVWGVSRAFDELHLANRGPNKEGARRTGNGSTFAAIAGIKSKLVPDSFSLPRRRWQSSLFSYQDYVRAYTVPTSRPPSCFPR